MIDSLTVSILGVVEGLTEFLPVSSTGHLILAGHILAFDGEGAKSFEIFIQLGAIAAVALLYWRRFWWLVRPPGGEENVGGFVGRRGITLLVSGCIPFFVLGFLLHKPIKAHLFTPLTVAIGLIVGAIVMLLVDRGDRVARVKSVDQLTLPQCLAVGVFQCFALWPGISRAAATMVGGLIVGLERSVAAEFSFLMAVPVLCVVTAADLIKSLPSLSHDDFVFFMLGAIVSFVVALLAVRVFIALIQRVSLAPFAYYRIVIGILVLLYLT